MSENYIVSARKYRPDSFASIVGQEATAQTLKSAVQSNRLAHAYLFCGPRGVGKTTAARVLAKTINCTNLSPDAEACNECESCKAFNEQRSFNIFELDAASNNSVDDIRGLTEQVAMPPSQGRYKVYIIDEVHMLSQAAFNAFLKTLEEPPNYAIFILATTERHKILPTILSRCQIYDFKRITVLDIVHHLAYVAQQEGITTEEEALALIAEKADGGMRDALSIFDRIASFSDKQITYDVARSSLNVLDQTEYIQFVDALLVGNYRGILLLLNELLQRGFDAQVIIGGLANFLRDLLVAQHPDTLALLEKPISVASLYKEVSQKCSTQMLYQGIKQLVGCDQQYKATTNKRLLVELTLLNLLGVFRSASQQDKNTNYDNSKGIPVPAEENKSSTLSRPKDADQDQTTIKELENVPEEIKSTGTNTTSEHKVHKENADAITKSVEVLKQKASIHITSPQQISASLGRERYRSLRGREQGVIEDRTENNEGIISDQEVYTNNDLQKAWQSYIETELDREKVICLNIMQQESPRLLGEERIEVSVTNTAPILEALVEERPKIERFLQRTLRNGAISLSIRAKKEEEEIFVPATSEDRYEHLAKTNDAVEKLRKGLSLRLL